MHHWRILLLVTGLVLAGPLGLRAALAVSPAIAVTAEAPADEPCAHAHGDAAAAAPHDAEPEHCGQTSACAAACAAACAPAAAAPAVSGVARAAVRSRPCIDEAIPPGRTIAPEPPPPTA
ncbi:hypothetical protein [Piscinibacter sp.]|uniref:hypothetical protein n=1 Tax=Piscinibacter sp. TaxID=1903157 RepID=UPI0039E6E507